jgi:hypothetical protein
MFFEGRIVMFRRRFVSLKKIVENLIFWYMWIFYDSIGVFTLFLLLLLSLLLLSNWRNLFVKYDRSNMITAALSCLQLDLSDRTIASSGRRIKSRDFFRIFMRLMIASQLADYFLIFHSICSISTLERFMVIGKVVKAASFGSHDFRSNFQ